MWLYVYFTDQNFEKYNFMRSFLKNFSLISDLKFGFLQ